MLYCCNSRCRACRAHQGGSDVGHDLARCGFSGELVRAESGEVVVRKGGIESRDQEEVDFSTRSFSTVQRQLQCPRSPRLELVQSSETRRQTCVPHFWGKGHSDISPVLEVPHSLVHSLLFTLVCLFHLLVHLLLFAYGFDGIRFKPDIDFVFRGWDVGQRVGQLQQGGIVEILHDDND